jgi:hypothetical protein
MTEREEPTEKQQNLRRNRANPRRQLSSANGCSESKQFSAREILPGLKPSMRSPEQQVGSGTGLEARCFLLPRRRG